MIDDICEVLKDWKSQAAQSTSLMHACVGGAQSLDSCTANEYNNLACQINCCHHKMNNVNSMSHMYNGQMNK